MATEMKPVYTIGHSTRPLDEFIDLLHVNNITQLIDIRSIPRSRHNPQYEHTSLEKSLPQAGIKYRHMKDLGGLRPKTKDSVNTAWRNNSFRNYADYMQTDNFRAALEDLISYAKKEPTAIMCAEAVPWRCHRSLIGDELLAHKIPVKDIMSKTTINDHTLTSFAVVDGETVTYPSTER